MRITYISHASLLIEADGIRIVTDPWYDGPAYGGQWNVFPKPVDDSIARSAEYVVLTHGHEDHLHEPTLRGLAGGKTALYPFYWYGGGAEYLSELGFERVIELESGRTHRLTPRVSLTFIVNGQDSIAVIEDGESVLVNVNDALHSSEPFLIDLYVDRLRKRWPKIDYVFCGYGGASYYPNTLHGPGKEDRDVALVREQLFAHNFCRIVHGLAPRRAAPFAADFVLLAAHQRWINEARFSRDELVAYYDRFFGGSVEVLSMAPGDRIDESGLAPTPKSGSVRPLSQERLLARTYPHEVSAFADCARMTPDEGERLSRELERHIASQLRYFDRRVTEGLEFSIEIRNLDGPNVMNVAVSHDGREARVALEATASGGAAATVDTVSEALRSSMGSDWGGDVIIIGYGAEVRVHTRQGMEQAVGRTILELLVRHPRPGHYALRHPARASRYVLHSWFAVRSRLLRKLGAVIGRGDPRPSPVSGRHWLSCEPDAIRRICELPPYEKAHAEPEQAAAVGT